jgi:mannose-6-phosphate isomerase-like protein (cupin superfamily)
MTYPPASYDGPGGEVSATFRPAGQQPDITYRTGGTAHYLATGATTNGRFGLYRWDMSAAVSGPSPHFHRTVSEAFFILSGTIKIYDGKEWVDTHPGDFVYVPEGGVHGFRNESGAPASMLIHFAPGAPREEYFEGLLHIADMSEEERLEFYLRHDNHWL